MKWVEVFPTANQTALTIAWSLLNISLAGAEYRVSRELLSDCGANFLSLLIQEVCKVMGISKVNTTAYYPQGDGLVERFNRTFE